MSRLQGHGRSPLRGDRLGCDLCWGYSASSSLVEPIKDGYKSFSKFYLPFRWWLHPHPRLDNRIIIAGTSLLAFELMIFWKILQLCCVTITRLAPQVVVISLWALEERNAITINTNDVSGRSTPSAVSYDGKLRHVGAAWQHACPGGTLTYFASKLRNAVESVIPGIPVSQNSPSEQNPFHRL